MKRHALFLIVCSTAGFVLFTGCRSYLAAVPGVRSTPSYIVVTEDRLSIRLQPERGSQDQPGVIAGHSLGGAMAARFVAREVNGSSAVAGVVLLGAYPPQSDPLVESPVPVLSIYAQNDGLVSEEERRVALMNLPESATIIEIEGGNHAGFGDYGDQDGDGERTVSLETQHGQTVAAITEFLDNQVVPIEPGC